MLNILLVDDDNSFTAATSEILKSLSHQVFVATSVSEANTLLNSQRFDLALLDIMLPDGSGFELLDEIYSGNGLAHVAFITGHETIKSLIPTMAGNEISFLLKPIDLDKIRSLLMKVERPLHNQSQSEIKTYFDVLIGETPAMHTLYELIERVGRSSANVLIQAPSGCGKELVARAIHNASACSGPFVAANCGAMPTELITSELFGHEKGAFTGAQKRKIGLFERAQNGTLFLDEVTEMPLDLQPNLLRVLETGKVTRVGGSEEIPVNCRVLSATNRTKEELASKQHLREDIYFRLAVFPMEIPTLSERKDDIPLLAQAFLESLNQEQLTRFELDANSLARLQSYEWPGNVRELRHAIQRAHIMTPTNATTLQLPEDLSSPFSSKPAAASRLQPGTTIQEIEKQLILSTVEATGGDKPVAAEMLGISLKTLYNRLNQYEVKHD